MIVVLVKRFPPRDQEASNAFSIESCLGLNEIKREIVRRLQRLSEVTVEAVGIFNLNFKGCFLPGTGRLLLNQLDPAL
jgi:hypothetical protein